VVPSWLALCWIAQGSGFESRNITTGGISQEGFAQGLVSPPATIPVNYSSRATNTSRAHNNKFKSE
jgi:hypothetical protein